MKNTLHCVLRASAHAAVLALALASWTGGRAAGQTTTLTFANGPTWQNLQAGYGDRIAGPTQGGFPYGGAGSYTPGVIAAFAAQDGGNTYPVFHWASGYNALTDARFPQGRAAAASSW